MSLPDLEPLPPRVVLETPEVLRALVKAHRYLAELKDIAQTVSNTKGVRVNLPDTKGVRVIDISG